MIEHEAVYKEQNPRMDCDSSDSQCGGVMPRQKSRRSMVQGWRFFRVLCEKILPAH